MTLLEELQIDLPGPVGVDGMNLCFKRLRELRNANSDLAEQAAVGWRGMAYRWRTCWEACEDFDATFPEDGNPSFEELYLANKHRFSFFTAGVSAIECLIYTVYCVAGVRAPQQVRIAQSDHLRLSRDRIVGLLRDVEPEEALPRRLQEILDSDKFQALVDERDVALHRGSLPRRHYLGGDRHGQTAAPANPRELNREEWDFSFDVSRGAFHEPRDWVAERLRELVPLVLAYIPSGDPEG